MEQRSAKGSPADKPVNGAINYLTRIEFGEGRIDSLPELLEQLGISKPLIATDQGLTKAGLAARASGKVNNYALFDGTPSNPTEAAVMEALEMYRAEGCDGIVGFGGGSSIDLAKALRLLTRHQPPLAQYAAINGGVAKIQACDCPMIAIPTTAGTGAEVGRAAVINTQEGRKLGLLSPHLLPTVALCDPELTYGLPPFMTAATAMDAISHCLETYMAPAFNPTAEAIALHGLDHGMRAIETAVADGQNVQARRDLMICAYEGALAFQKGLGAVHALTHPLGAIEALNLHHGTLNAVLMPEVLRFNRQAIGDKWQVLTAKLGGDPARVIADLNQRIGIPSGLRELGVTDAMMEEVAEMAMLDHCHATNPKVPTRAEYLEILQKSA